MTYKKKLIEVALPLEEINAQSAREKSIRHGHPSTLHLWWARRPLATARAVIWSSLVDDPSSHPELFPTKEEQDKERQRLFEILKQLVRWENTNNPEILKQAKAEITKSMGENLPPLLDPFAGGGSIPLEAQRLGLKAYAHDLNPVAVMINKAMIEIPPKFANQPPVNPENAHSSMPTDWSGTQGLAEDVRYYGNWILEKAKERIGHLYPKVKDEQGIEHTVIAWIWTRTVKCPNPACGCEMPLANSFILSQSPRDDVYLQPIINGSDIKYTVKYGKIPKEIPQPKTGRGSFQCICCGTHIKGVYIQTEGRAKRIGSQLLAIVADSEQGRLYLSPDVISSHFSNIPIPECHPDADLYGKVADQVPLYGYSRYSLLFTYRQLSALTTFFSLITEARTQVVNDGGSEDYANAITVYLTFVMDKLTDYNSSFCTWHISREGIRNTFGRQALAMNWAFVEANPLGNSSGCFDNMLDGVIRCLSNLPANYVGFATQHDAQLPVTFSNVIVSTDPPYYDNICFADLSDFFYIWMRQSLKDIYPELFKTMLVPKVEEIVASPYRFQGGSSEACRFFEEGMFSTFKQIYSYAFEEVPVTVYYAYKQSETEGDGTASTGWETMLTAIIKAGFTITGTWPMRTELPNRMNGRESNVLASSVVLVCRKRPVDMRYCSRRDFMSTLRDELRPALDELQKSNIAPVDMAQSAIGPGMSVFSRYAEVLESDGTPMSVRTALQIINQELDLYFSEQDGEMDSNSRFCIDLYSQYEFKKIEYGVADVLARAKNTSVEDIRTLGALYSGNGVVYLVKRDELTTDTKPGFIWLLIQQLTHALKTEGIEGVARIIAGIESSEPDRAIKLAYHLYNVAERKGWATEARAYNDLIIQWNEVQNKVKSIQKLSDLMRPKP